MSLKSLGNVVRNYTLIGVMLTISWVLSSHFTRSASDAFFASREQGETLFILCGIVIIFTLGFIIYELAKPTPIPSFVLAVIFGLVCRDILSIITDNPVTLTTLIVIGSVLILFEGGLETPFMKFRSLIGPILSLAFFGTIINAMLFSYLLVFLTEIYGIVMPIPAIILLGAAIASTDPAAIIPSLQTLIFKKSRVKHIAISESAINDVVGAVLVGIFLTFFFEGHIPETVADAYMNLLSIGNATRIVHALIIGTGVGLTGFAGLHLW
ncbi:MAG: cation:proton antiporter, partial [Candidatus Peregrinibacteria bacterium]|nr:cation:proton antiporter [Candidatus Peregrinibacteria bacterium]